MFYWFAYSCIWLFSQIFFPITVLGRNNLPRSGKVILASNHVSNLDPLILGLTFRRRISYLAKDTLFKNKIFAWILYHVSAFPIKRNTSDFGALRESLRRLEHGSLVVFPEGTRKSNEPQQGIGFLAVKSKVPVIPAYISGSDQAMPAGAKWPKRAPVKVIFGEPVYFSGSSKDYEQISASLMQQIESLKLS